MDAKHLVDILSLALTHGLLAIAAWRIAGRADLDPPGRARRGRKDAGDA